MSEVKITRILFQILDKFYLKPASVVLASSSLNGSEHWPSEQVLVRVDLYDPQHKEHDDQVPQSPKPQNCKSISMAHNL